MDDSDYPRDRIERRLRATEERFRLAQAAGGIGWFEWDLSSDEWEWTQPVARLFGFGANGPGRSFADWERTIFADDAPKVRAAVAAAVETGSYYAEFRVKHPDGSLHWIAGKGECTKDADTSTAWIAGVYYEITERKALEARLLGLNETLEGRVAEVREEARTLEILNRTGAALAGELSLQRLVQTVTDAGAELAGAEFGAFFYNAADAEGESYTLFALSGAPREAFEKFPSPRNTAMFEPTFRGLGPVRSDDILADPRYGQNAPHYGMPPDHLPVRSYLAVPVVSRSGEVIGGLFFAHRETGKFTERAERIIVGVAAQAAIALDNARLYEASQHELTARRAAEAELQRINETLEERVSEEIGQRQQMEETLRQAQKMEVIGQLTGGVAHDFNNLLMVILGNLETVQRRLSADHELQRLVSAAIGGASRAAQLTQRLLAFARRQPLAPEILSPNKLVADMSDLLRRALGESIGMDMALAARVWNTFADTNQLENALINLIVNARDAMPQGGRLSIETGNCYLDEAYCAREHDVSPGEYVGIFVTDTGSGMSEEVMAKAFEPFFTTKDIQGTGLGLSQVYGFVRQSGGHVKIYSAIGEGTSIKLYFPRHESAAAAPTAPERDVVRSPRAKRGDTVLVVEDDPDVREHTVDVTKELGYRVVSAADATAALQLLDSHPELRLLFTDVGLPGMNGRQLAEEAMRRRPDMKVLFTTGYARDAIVHDGRLDPGLEVVLKPFSYSDLAVKIRRALDS
ncbi:MAG TPA: ATP-binding protein [Stellaceae bacterium]|nr:ATP-binding protein [Stellaceae bacterium]